MTERGAGEDRLVTCDCHIEALRVVRWADEPESTYVSLWEEKTYSHWTPLRQRLRHIWRIIRYGEPWEDEIVLSAASAWVLARALTGCPDDATMHWSRYDCASNGNPHVTWTTTTTSTA